jgi:hypothetical protein
VRDARISNASPVAFRACIAAEYRERAAGGAVTDALQLHLGDYLLSVQEKRLEEMELGGSGAEHGVQRLLPDRQRLVQLRVGDREGAQHPDAVSVDPGFQE